MDQALIICTPGLEKELLREMQEVWPYLLSPQAVPQSEAFPEVEFLKGGIQIPCDIFRAVQFNFFLKTATRVLWRVAQFRCRDFPKLYQNFKKINWNPWIGQQAVQFHVAAAGSRLNNEKRIEQVGVESLPERKSLRTPAVGIYIRNHDDQFTISVDLSGETLHKRILEKKIGEAPFRETWAHFILRRMMFDEPLANVKKICLVDPFAGSGTFLLEALTFQQPNFSRDFSFQHMPGAPKLFRSPSFAGNYFWPRKNIFFKISGKDIDPKMVANAEENITSTTKHFSVSDVEINLEVGDAFSEVPRDDQPTWLVCNPPWGERLKLNATFDEMVQRLVKAWHPQKMAFVLPTGKWRPGGLDKNYSVQEKIELSLGGQSVDVWYLKRV